MVKWINQAADGVTFDLKGFSSTTKIPAYILMHLDTLKLLPKEVLTKTLLERSLTTDNTPKLPRLLKIVLTLWEQASDSQVHPTGVVSFSFGSGGWTPYDVNKYLKNFLETDPSGAVAAIYLEQSIKDLQSYLESKIISDTQLVALGKLQWIFEQTSYIEFKQDQISQLINKVRPFKAELSTSEIGFIEQLPIFEIEHSTRSFNHYKKLNVCTGEVATQSPVFSKLIFEVASVEELVTKMKHLPTGFALCLVKNSNPADSYFAIAVKNGGNLTILSDVPSYAHPLQEQMMAARNNRYNMERHCEYLPYELMNLTWEDKGRTCTDESTSKSIIDPSTDIKILGNFNQLSIKQMLWIGHFFELCYERYFISNVVEPTLSLISKHNYDRPLLNVVKETGTAVVVANQFPELQTLTSKALTRKEMVKHYPELEKHPQPNLWLEKKYAKLVNDDVLYVTADIEEVNLLPVLDKEVKTRTVTTLQSINPVLIPTTKLMGLAEAQATSHFIARKNQAKAIARIAQDDFDTRKNNLVNWVYRNITKNLPNLIDDLVSFNHKRFQIIGKDAATITDYDGIGLFGSSLRQVHLVNITFEQAYISKKEDQSKLSHYIGDLFHRGEYMNLCYLCSKHEYFSENQSGDWYCEAYNRLILNISNVADIELLTGIERYSLPEELQNYGVTSSGVNTILNLHDPMDSISNPWNKLDFNFSLPISKKALNERRKQLGLGKVTSEHYANVWDRNEVGEKLRSALYYNIYGDLRGDARTGNPMVSELPVTPWLSNVPKYFNFKK